MTTRKKQTRRQAGQGATQEKAPAGSNGREEAPQAPLAAKKAAEAGGGAVADTRPAEASPPRWIMTLDVVRANFWRLVAAGFVGCLVTAIVTLLMDNTYQARASLILDETPTLVTADEEGEQTVAVGMPQVSVPTLEGLLTQPQMAAIVLQIVGEVQRGELNPQAVLRRIEGGEAAETSPSQLPLKERVLLSLSSADTQALAGREAARLLQFSPEQLLKLIEVEPRIEKKLAFDVVYSPLIYVRARANSPTLSRLLANIWVSTFAAFYDSEIARRQMLLNQRFLENSYGEALRTWRSTQNELSELLSRTSLPVKKQLYEETTKALDEVEARLLAAERELEQKEKQLIDTDLKLRVLTTQQGDWVGLVTNMEEAQKPASELGKELTVEATVESIVQILDIPPDEEQGVSSVDALTSAGLTRADIKIYNQLRMETIDARTNFVNSTERLQSFERENKLEEFELRKQDAVARLNEYMRSLRQLQIQVETLKQAKDVLAGLVENVDRFLRLETVLPIEVIHQMGAGNREAQGEASERAQPPGTYFSEEINPTWIRLDERYNDLLADLGRLEPELVQTGEALQQTTQEVAQLQEELSSLRLEQQLLRNDQEDAAVIHQELGNQYRQMRSQRIRLSGEVIALRMEISQLEDRRRVLQEKISGYYDEILKTEDAEAILTSEIEAQQQRVEVLRERLKNLETQLSEYSQVVKVATLAISPEEKVWPPRTVLTLAGGAIVALAFLIYLLVAEELARREGLAA